MLLTIDAGNSNIVFGLYQDDLLVARWRAATESTRTGDDLAALLLGWFGDDGFKPDQIDGVCIASVVPALNRSLDDLGRRYLRRPPTFVSHQLDLGVRVRVDQPHLVGADRLGNVVAAYSLFGGPCLVIDFGTATKLEAITADGDYLGGAIAPGIGILRDALLEAAPALAAVESCSPQQTIGRNTDQSMASGLDLGYLGLVEGLIARMRQALGPPVPTIATGGLAPTIAGQTAAIDHLRPSLTLDGLRLIWARNR